MATVWYLWGEGLGVHPLENFGKLLLNGAILGIYEQNFETILARSGALLCPGRGKLGLFAIYFE